MRQTVINYMLILLVLLTMSCQVTEQPSDRTKLDTLDYSYFVDPPNEFRSHPFYSINDSLTEEEIIRQIREFKDAGFGGFYLHSRSGLITEFLGEDWWKVMQAAVDAANEVGLRCMFYDEDKWPSGYAGGIIPRMSEDYRAKCLANGKQDSTGGLCCSGNQVEKKAGDFEHLLSGGDGDQTWPKQRRRAGQWEHNLAELARNTVVHAAKAAG